MPQLQFDYTINVMDFLALIVGVMTLIATIYLSQHIKKANTKVDQLLREQLKN